MDTATDGPRELIVLGSGTAVPTPRRAPSGLLIIDGEHVVLVDPGPGSLKRTADAGFPVHAITKVLLTHHHPDHCLDVVALLFALKNPSVEARAPHVEIVGGPGTRNLLTRFRKVFGGWITPADGLVVEREVEPGWFQLTPTIEVFAAAMEHTPASLGYRLTFHDGTTLALSGDTDECAGALEIGSNVDHYLLEASFPEHLRVVGHLTPERAASIAAECRAHHLILSHFYPEVDTEQARDVAARRFAGRLTIAEDGLRIPLHREKVESTP